MNNHNRSYWSYFPFAYDFQNLLQREHRLDLNCDIARQRAHSDGAARANTFVRSPDFGEQFTASIDDLRMFFKSRSAMYHAEYFDDSLHLVEAPQMGPQSR